MQAYTMTFERLTQSEAIERIASRYDHPAHVKDEDYPIDALYGKVERGINGQTECLIDWTGPLDSIADGFTLFADEVKARL